MLRSRLFWKLLLTFAALNLAGLATLGYLAIDRQRRQAAEDVADELTRAVRVIKSTLPSATLPGGRDRLQQFARETARASGDRVTLLDAEGAVLADSSVESIDDVDEITGLGPRPDVVAAMAGGWGVDTPTAGSESTGVVSAAIRVSSDSPVHVIRASRPLGAAAQRLDQQRDYLIAACAVVGALYAIGASVLLRHVVLPVKSLNEAADAISRGDYQQRAFVPGNDELGVLADSFNRMSKELGSQLIELRESGQRHATVLGGMIEGVIAVDDRERVLFANTAAAKLFDFIPPQVEGRPLLEVARHHMLHESVATALATGRPQRLEVQWEGAERLTLMVQVTPLPGDPCPGVVVVLHDTTELRRLESLRQDFVANVSHELKTPLSSIKAYTETLLDGAVNDSKHNVPFLRRIEEQADRLNNLIQDLLALARIESAQHAFEIRSVAIAEVVSACLNDYRNQAEAKQITLEAEPEDRGLHVSADPEGLRVIVSNLVDNAIKYTSAGGRVAVRWRPSAPGRVAIDVSDSGIGIPAESLPRVFERFFRVDKARSRELGGTGLGLAIVKHLSQAFGGTVTVDSREGEGTTFTVTLPAA